MKPSSMTLKNLLILMIRLNFGWKKMKTQKRLDALANVWNLKKIIDKIDG